MPLFNSGNVFVTQDLDQLTDGNAVLPELPFVPSNHQHMFPYVSMASDQNEGLWLFYKEKTNDSEKKKAPNPPGCIKNYTIFLISQRCDR